MRVIASYTIKGGVGKTSAAVNLAWLSAQAGNRTLLWDLDPQGAATFMFRIRPRVKGGARGLVERRRQLIDAVKATDFDGLDLLPADFSYRNLDLALDSAKKPTQRIERLLRSLRDEYDVVVLDCPPSVSLVSENVLAAADVLVVPVVPSPLSTRTFDQLLEFVSNMTEKPPKIVGFFSMVDRRKKLHRDLVAELPLSHRDMLPVVIPAAAVVERMGVARAPLGVLAPDSDAARAYAHLWSAAGAR